jgi:ribulose-phosphate 3-epimerase
MSVEPGYGGQPFIDITDKINWLREYRKTNNLSYKIEVDGGINNDVINKVRMCDIVVCGSYITNSLDYEEKIRSLR